MAKILGITEDRTECDCCGKTDLKRTVAIEHEDGRIGYYGTSCAAKILKWDAATVTKTARTAEKQRHIERERFISEHPLTKEAYVDFKSLRALYPADIRPMEWLEISKEHRVKWREWEGQVKREADEKFRITA